MQQPQILVNPDSPHQPMAQDAARIPALGHTEAAAMATVEMDRFLGLIESLSADDWTKPTACTMWDVREMVAHVAGATASSANLSEARRQNSPRVQRPYRKGGFSRLDAQNQIQVDDRAGVSPADLIAELREVGSKGVDVRRRIPALVRSARLPLGLVYPMGRIWVPIGYMSDVIMNRDVWMHRLDICRATAREMDLTPGHDGRMTALVMRDLAGTLAPKLGSASVVYELSGPAGGVWQIGDGRPSAKIRMDALDLHLLAAGRLSTGEARRLVEIEGDLEHGNQALGHTSVVY